MMGFNKATPTAPYNFVHLNKSVLLSPLGKRLKDIVALEKSDDKDRLLQQAYKDYLLDGEKLSGYFDVEITSLCSLYIGGSNGFFSDGKNLCIPGSSLRGCLKNYFKIITNGSMNVDDNPDVCDDIIYYRAQASACKSFKNTYKNEMQQVFPDGKRKSQSRPGFLVRYEKDYFICPVDFNDDKDWKVKTSSRNASPTEKPSIEWDDDKVRVYSGQIDGKKHYYVFDNADWWKRYKVTDAALKSYKDDKKRDGIDLLGSSYAKNGAENLSILEGAELYDYIIPCFFVAKEGEVLHFGSGPYYRVPYRHCIAEHIPENLKTDNIDFEKSIFGNKELWGSRVFFDNFYLVGDGKNVFENEQDCHPLLGAQPSFFQNYLMSDDNGEACHWNDLDAKIRGYKLYWHKKCNWPDHRDNKENSEVTKKIAPVKENNKFKGRIRFENLDAVELGALARLLSIGQQGSCRFSLGMGKPLGMGAIRLETKLYVQNKKYYTELFDKGIDLSDLKTYADKFKEYVNKEMSASEYEDYQSRIHELELMLDYSLKDIPGWEDETEYTDIEKERELINRRIPLPMPSEVAGKTK